MELRTKRLVLRRPRKNDLPNLVKNISNIRVSKWLLTVPYPYTIKDARWYLNHSAKKWGARKKTGYAFFIALKSNRHVIGGCGIDGINKSQGTAEVGYWLGEKYWRRGYGSEALDAMLKFTFNSLKLRRVSAPIFAGNPSSGKLLEKYGFKKEGLKRKSAVCKANGKIRDEVVYGLLKEEWKADKRKRDLFS